MNYDDKKLAGLLLFLSGVLGVLGIIVSEALYPCYSTSENYISDLGVGPSAIIFNTSFFFVGVCTVAGSFFIQRAFSLKIFSFLTTMAGIGAMGVGLFPVNIIIPHGIASLTTFLFGGLSSIASFNLQNHPFSYLFVLLGAVSLVALTLFFTGFHLGLGIGGMERMIAYPILLWAIGFGGLLMSS